MIKASELKEGDLVSLPRGDMRVISNHVGDVIFLHNEESKEYKGLHLFYDDVFDVADARSVGVDLT